MGLLEDKRRARLFYRFLSTVSDRVNPTSGPRRYPEAFEKFEVGPEITLAELMLSLSETITNREPAIRPCGMKRAGLTLGVS